MLLTETHARQFGEAADYSALLPALPFGERRSVL